MDNETNATEAEQKKTGDLTDSIARMTACLEDVIANAKAALTLSKDMDRDGMKWMTLSKAVFDVHERSRMGWQKLVDPPTAYDPAAGTGGGAFFTPKQAIDFIMGNPPFGDVKDAATPLDPNAPKLVRGDGQVWKAIGTDTCGIRRANGTVRAWAIRENAGVEVFAKQIFKDGKPEPCWTFSGTVDCEKVIFGGILGGRNKANQIVRFIRNGLLSSRLRLKHKRMNKKVREAASAIAGEKAVEVPNA